MSYSQKQKHKESIITYTNSKKSCSFIRKINIAEIKKKQFSAQLMHCNYYLFDLKITLNNCLEKRV